MFSLNVEDQFQLWLWETVCTSVFFLLFLFDEPFLVHVIPPPFFPMRTQEVMHSLEFCIT